MRKWISIGCLVLILCSMQVQAKEDTSILLQYPGEKEKYAVDVDSSYLVDSYWIGDMKFKREDNPSILELYDKLGLDHGVSKVKIFKPTRSLVDYNRDYVTIEVNPNKEYKIKELVKKGGRATALGSVYDANAEALFAYNVSTGVDPVVSYYVEKNGASVIDVPGNSTTLSISDLVDNSVLDASIIKEEVIRRVKDMDIKFSN